MTESKTLADALPEEIARCREVLTQYAALGAVGRFGFAMITSDIETAEKATREGDTVGMLRAYYKLQEVK